MSSHHHDRGPKGKPPGRVQVDRPSTPLGNPFAALGEIEALKSLRVEEKPKPAPVQQKPRPPQPAQTRSPQTAPRPAQSQPAPAQGNQSLQDPAIVVEKRQKPPKPAPPVIEPGSKGRLILRREKKDRGGKTVVVVYGFKDLPGSNAAIIANLSRDLKNKLGCGGSFDRQEIVLQGDRAGAVCTALEAMGYRVDGVKEDGPQQ
jgi:translation initiation factor 1 (eIF-1/SUI1)